MLVTKVCGPDTRAGADVENPSNLCAGVIGRRGSEAITEGPDEKIIVTPAVAAASVVLLAIAGDGFTNYLNDTSPSGLKSQLHVRL